MPYQVKKVKGGYKVKDNKGKAYSKKPLPKLELKSNNLISLNFYICFFIPLNFIN